MSCEVLDLNFQKEFSTIHTENEEKMLLGEIKNKVVSQS